MHVATRVCTATAVMTLLALVLDPAHAGPRRARKKKANVTKKANPPNKSQARSSSGPCKPWVCGVSGQRQEKALALYQEGNQLFEDSVFVGAVAKYQAAIELWDHPAIHYNLALAQMGLDQPIKAYKNVQASLRHGGQALEPRERSQARALRARLQRKIARVHVVCQEPGAAVTLDGRPVFTGPGEKTIEVLAGLHQIHAYKPNYVAASKTVQLAPKRRTAVELRLIREEDARITIRRWPRWLPWAIAAAGSGLGAAGMVLDGRAERDYAEYTRRLRIQCASGCDQEPGGINEFYQRARWQKGVAYGTYALAGLAVVGGLTMVYFNMARVEENRALRDLVRVSIAPVLSGDVTGIAASMRF